MKSHKLAIFFCILAFIGTLVYLGLLHNPISEETDKGRNKGVTSMGSDDGNYFIQAVDSDKAVSKAAIEELTEKVDPKKKILEKWKILFGRVDLSENPYFNSLTYLHPKPDDRLLPYRNVVLSDVITENHAFWINEFFKGTFLKTIDSTSPFGYYLNQGRNEPGLLAYKCEYKESQIRIIENRDALLLSITPESFESDQGVNKGFIVDFLNEAVSVSVEKVDELFAGIPSEQSIPEGFKFSSDNAGSFRRFRNWQDHIIGFIGKNGVNFILFKRKYIPNQKKIGISYDFDWVDNNLEKLD